MLTIGRLWGQRSKLLRRRISLSHGGDPVAGMGLTGLWFFLTLVIAGSILLALAAIRLGDRIGRPTHGSGHNEVLASFLTTVSLVYGALLGFTVVVAWEQFSSAESNVNGEASTLVTMYRQTVGMPAAERAETRRLLHTYAAAAQDEWDPQSREKASNDARSSITGMYRILAAQAPIEAANPISGQFLSELSALSSQRDTRILDTRPRIPGLLWTGLIFGGVVLVALMGFTRVAEWKGHAVVSGAVTILLGLLMFLIFWLDRPFGEELGVTPAPFKHAVQAFNSID